MSTFLSRTLGSQNLEFITNSGIGRYRFEYAEYAVVDDVVISDSLPPGLFNVSCRLDGQPSSAIMYSSSDGLFQVNQTTGALSLQDGRQLDFETRDEILFAVTCSLSGSSITTVAQVDFTVLPVNEFPPVFPRGSRTLLVSVREVTSIGTVLAFAATFNVTDEDGGPDGELEYTLAFNENLTSFAVDRLSGTLTVTQNLDVDNTPFGFDIEMIRLTVCDIKPPVESCPNAEITVVITSANDNNPIFTQDIYRVMEISEDVPSGSMITNVSCTDADVGVGRFENVTSSASLFNVTMNPGYQTILLDGELDFETSRSHNVSLTCYDSNGRTASAILLVTVGAINDNRPRFPSSEYYFVMSRILTTGNEIGRVVAIDGDQVVGGDLTYTMMDNENFQIQGDGSIILNDFVYVVEGQVFTLTVGVSDGEFSDSATVVITVNGVLSVPEIILTCMGALVFLVLVIFIIVFCCWCCVCCSRLIPKQRHVDVPVEVYKNDAAVPDAGMMTAIPMTVPVPMHMGGMYEQGKSPPYMMAVPQWGSQFEEEEVSEEEGAAELGSIGTASSRVYSPTPFLKEMVDMFKEGDEILEGKKSKKK